MKTVRLDDVVGSEDDVHGETWNSRRLLLARDNMGFSVHDTIIHEGTVTKMWYRHHLEAVYCIEGKGKVITVSDGKEWPIEAGTIYALDKNDKHELYAETRMRMVCVFNPPVTGKETHGPDGAYPAPSED